MGVLPDIHTQKYSGLHSTKKINPWDSNKMPLASQMLIPTRTTRRRKIPAFGLPFCTHRKGFRRHAHRARAYICTVRMVRVCGPDVVRERCEDGARAVRVVRGSSKIDGARAVRVIKTHRNDRAHPQTHLVISRTLSSSTPIHPAMLNSRRYFRKADFLELRAWELSPGDTGSANPRLAHSSNQASRVV